MVEKCSQESRSYPLVVIEPHSHGSGGLSRSHRNVQARGSIGRMVSGDGPLVPRLWLGLKHATPDVALSKPGEPALIKCRKVNQWTRFNWSRLVASRLR